MQIKFGQGQHNGHVTIFLQKTQEKNSFIFSIILSSLIFLSIFKTISSLSFLLYFFYRLYENISLLLDYLIV